jgi:RHS repeat-associated protein
MLRRLLVLLTVIALGVSFAVPDAGAVPAAVPNRAPTIPIHGYAPAPVQHDGTAAGRGHTAPAAATRATGHPAGHQAPTPQRPGPAVGTRIAARPTPPRLAAGHPVTAADTATGGDDASYTVASVFDTAPMANQNGWIPVTLTNTGTTTWDSGYTLRALIFPGNSHTGTPLSTGTAVSVNTTVAPGATVTVESVTPAEVPGSYTACWDMADGAGTLFSDEGGTEYCAPYTVRQYPATISEQEPLPGTDVDSQTPMLSASATVPGGFPTDPAFSFAFRVLNGPNASTAAVLQSSGWVADHGNSWSPATALTWGTTYYWQVTVSAAATPPSLSGTGITWTTPISFVVGNAQPAVFRRLGNAYQADDGNPVMTSDLGGTDYAGSGKTVDPKTGNVSEQATDATVATVGPALSVVRTYNSLDPRTTQAFGAGWSSTVDMSLVPDVDGSGALVLTLADGRQVRLAKTVSGGYAPPQDLYAVVTPAVGGGFSVTDQTAQTYTFAQASGASWLISRITDNAGRAVTFGYTGGQLTTITSTASGRALHLTWSTPAGAGTAHVASVSTDAVAAGVSGTTLTGTYGYQGDLLTAVCSPVSTTACTHYGYTTGASHAATAVRNADPTGYYRLDDAVGTTAAHNEIPVNDLATLDPPATEMNTTPGVAGPVPGVTATAFNGTSSFIPLDGAWCPTPGQVGACVSTAASGRLLTSAATAVSLWFKTTTTSGILLSFTSALPSDCSPFCVVPLATPLLWIGGNGKLDGYGSLVSSGVVTDGAWHQAVLVPGQALYVDGAKVASGNGPGPTASSGTYALLGAGLVSQNAFYDSWSYFKGSLADVSIYQNQLPSAGTVAAQYAAETQPAAELTTVTSPAGRGQLAATYDTTNDRVASLVDASGGTWTYGQPVPGASSTGYAAAVLGSAPEDFWPLNDTAGPTARDLIGTSDATTAVPRPPATYSGITLGAAGPTGFADGTAASFGGGSAQISVAGGYFAGTGAESAELWFNTKGTGTLLSSGPSNTGGEPLGLSVATGGCLVGTVGSTTVNQPIFGTCSSSITTVNDGYWHQAVLTVSPRTDSSQTVRLYLDGVSVATASVTTAPKASNTGYTVVLGKGMTGSLADASLYTKALSSTDITAHYNGLHRQVAPPASVSAPLLNTQTVTVTNPIGGKTAYLYVNQGLMRITNPLGGTTWYGYDGAGRAATVTDPEGNTSYTTFDAHNNVTSVTTCAAVADCQTSYAAYAENLANPLDPRNDKPTDQRDPRSSSPSDPAYDTVTTYTATGQIASLAAPPTNACPAGCRRGYTYTAGTEAAAGGATAPAGLVATVTAPGGGVTRYTYDAAGDVATVTNPLGLVTSYTYDNLGRELTQTQTSDTYPGGLTTRYTYDGLDRPVTQADPPVTDRVTGAVHTKTSSYTYDADSSVLHAVVSDPTGGDPSRGVTNTYDTHGHLATVTDPLGLVTGYTYDAMGDRTSQTDPAATTTTYAYDAVGDLVSSTLKGYTGDPSAPTAPADLVLESRAYDPAGRLASTTDVKGTTTQYTYYGDNQLASSSVTVPGSTTKQRVTTYAYDVAGNLVTETDPGGLVITRAYNADSQVVTETADPSGAARTLTGRYDADGNVVSSTISQGGTSRTVTATYDALGHPLTQTLAGQTIHYTYDRRGLVVAATDPAGNTERVASDEAGRAVVTTLPAVPTQLGPADPVMANPVTMTGYDTFGEQVESADADGHVTTAAYDTGGQKVSVTDPTYTPPGASTPVAGTIRMTYTSTGQPASVTDPLGNVTTTTYDQLGRTASQTDANSKVWTYAHDAAGEQIGVTDPTGARTGATFDGLGQMVTSTDLVRQNAAAAETTHYAYNDAGEQVSQTDPTGVTASAMYDALGQATLVTDGAGNTTRLTYNLDGGLTQATLPDGSATTQTYDAVGRPVATADLDPTGAALRSASVTYDADGNVTSATDYRGDTATATYDATGEVLTQTQPVLAGQSITVRYGYDLNGNVTALTNGNGDTTYTTYNARGLPESVVEPPTAAHSSAADSTSTDAYDADGDLVSETLPGGVRITNSYDAAGNLTAQSGSGASAPTATRTFTYDDAGRMLTATTGAAGTPGTFGYQAPTAESFGWDDRGLLLTTSGTAGASAFGYNAAGQLTSVTDAAGPSTYTYDRAGRLATDTDAASGATGAYTYNTLGQVSRISYGTGGDVQAFGYDSLHRVASDTISTASGATAAAIGYGYDANDDVTSMTTTGLATPSGTGTVTNTYGYDQADRLTSWVATPSGGSGTSHTFGYDPDGNLVNDNGITQVYDARDEMVSDSTGDNDTYSADGDLLTQVSPGPSGTTTWTSSTDAYGQQATSGSASSYRYDGLGRLVTVGKLLDSAYTIALTYDGMSDDIASDSSATYSRDPSGGLVGVHTTSGLNTLALNNAHRDLSGVFTATGTSLTGSTTYAPWGQVQATAGPAVQLGYQGQWTDPITQQVSMGARFYRPQTGGFSNQDTANSGAGGPAVTDNLHAYADDNPMTLTDLSGHAPASGDGGDDTVTAGQVQAAAARAAAAKRKAANAAATARSAWVAAGAASRAASADAAEARRLNTEAASLLRQYNSVSQQADAAFAAARQAASAAAGDRAQAQALQSQLYTTVVKYIPTHLGEIGGSGGSPSLSCGSGPSLTTGMFVGQTATCTVGQSAGGGGTSGATYIKVTERVINQSVEKRIEQLESDAKHEDALAFKDTDRGLNLMLKAIVLFTEYETTREEAAVAEGRASRAASYATEQRDRAVYLSKVADQDAAAARKAEEEYLERQARYKAQHKNHHPKSTPHPRKDKPLKTPPGNTGPTTIKTPPANKGPFVLKTPPANTGPVALRTPPAPQLPTTTIYPIAPQGPVIDSAVNPGNTLAAGQGTAIHNGPEWVEHLDSLDYGHSAYIKSGARPDGFTVDGYPVELKPDTKSGIKAGTRQLRRYLGDMKTQYGELWVYNVDGSGEVTFRLAAVPKSAYRWMKW